MPDASRRGMTRLAAIVAVLVLGAVPVASANPCALPANDGGALASVDLSRDGGIGGTGIHGDDSGIGGTGLQEDAGIGGTGIRGDDSGIGGTGLQADGGDSGLGGTGIFGTVTAFGSVCVNGLRIHYPDDAEVFVNGQMATAGELAVGQVVWIVAAEHDGRLETRRIAVHSAVTGRIEAIDTGRRQLRVAGRDVLLPADARAVVVGAQRRTGIEALAVGENVDVSGLSDARGRVVASRVVVIASRPRVASTQVRVADLVAGVKGLGRLSIEGYVDARLGADRFRVGGLEVDLSGRPDPIARIDRGARIRAVGRLAADGSLHVERPPERPPRVAPPTRDELQPAPEPSPHVRGVDSSAGDVTRVPTAPRIDSPKSVIRPEVPHRIRPDRPEVPRPEPIERPVIDRPPRPATDAIPRG